MSHVAQLFARARHSKSIFMEQLPNDESELDVATTVLPMGTAGLHRLEDSELFFPISEDVRSYADDLSDLADSKEQFVWKLIWTGHARRW